jgi:hypothetical protein
MDEKTLSFNENQLKRTGFSEAFTPDLISKMNQRIPLIEHNFKKDFEGDRVTATLHLKKSATSDNYFLNKFNVQLQKDGQANSTSQTFYLTKKPQKEESELGETKNRYENKYTLKEAYNLLAGRPVFKTLVNSEGEKYNAWVKLNFKNTLDSGNSEMKQYTKNYGFDLETALSKYPIKELTNDQYKQSLVDSLQRGNLQKATFVDPSGKEEKLYISPSITTGSLNVYDLNKQRLPTEALIEKSFIGNDLANQLKQFVSKLETKVTTVGVESSANQKVDQKVDQKKTLRPKDKNEEPTKKQGKKQKVH